MMRISVSGKSAEAVILRVEGQLAGPWVEELRKSCEALLAEGSCVSLVATGISFASSSGLLLLRDLMNRGVELRNCPLFLAAQLKEFSEP